MKKVKMEIPNIPPPIRSHLNTMVSKYEGELELDEKANLIDVLMKVDEKLGSRDYILTYNIWDPLRNKIYEQIAFFAYVKEPINNLSPKIRQNPLIELPDDTTIKLQPGGLCITDYEDLVDRNTFLKLIEDYKKSKR